MYVDGFNLYHGLKEASGHELLWLDLVKLAHNLRPRSRVVQVKYFTAMVLDEPDAQSRQDRYIHALSAAHPGSFTTIKGKYMRKEKRCHTCGARWTSYEEKQTDVNIAVHLVADVAASRADTFIIMSGDTDVIPAVKMSWSMNQDATILAMFPPGRRSDALSRLMPSSREITVAKARKALLPDTVIAANGARYARPDKWTSESTAALSPSGHVCMAAPQPSPNPGTVASTLRKMARPKQDIRP